MSTPEFDDFVLLFHRLDNEITEAKLYTIAERTVIDALLTDLGGKNRKVLAKLPGAASRK